MNEASLIEYRILSSSHHAVVMSLFAKGLRNTALIQLLGLDTGTGRALSIFAVYREEPMTFETSAKLNVSGADCSVEVILRKLVEDESFLNPLVTAMRLAVNRHFARAAVDMKGRSTETDDRSTTKPRASARRLPAP